MDTKDLDRIEKYLSGKMLPEENKKFEKEFRESKDLADLTKKVAYIIYSINVVGLKKDNERIKRIYTSVSNDYKRFVVSIAAMLAVALVFATVVSVPVYHHVVKPIIKKVFHSTLTPKQASAIVPVDTMPLSVVDTLGTDTANASIVHTPKNVEPQVKIRNTSKVEKSVLQKVVEKKLDTVVPVKVDTIISVKVDTVTPIVAQKVLPLEPSKPVNRIVSYSLLENYEFGDVSARREGNNVVCSFTMKNVKENAKIQMHSARAKDGNGQSYLAKNCLLNGQNKRIIEKWKKNEVHLVEITIENIPYEMIGFESISFSFQSEGDSLKQKSQSIILKVGEIK